jgi:hypothetical protein
MLHDPAAHSPTIMAQVLLTRLDPFGYFKFVTSLTHRHHHHHAHAMRVGGGVWQS